MYRLLSALFLLFRFASVPDILLLIVGTLAAIIHGAALPVSMHYFGVLTNVFINQFTSKTLANFEFRFDPVELLDSQCFDFIDVNLFLSGFINFTALSGGVVNCSEDFILIPNTITFNRALTCGVTRLAECLDDQTFIPLVNLYVIVFAVIGFCVFLIGPIQIFAFQVTSDRQIRRIKERFFRSLLYQSATWYDTKSTGELISRLSNDMEKIHEGIGVKLSIFIQWMTTFVAGLVVGFVTEWRLTLLLLGVTPFIMITIVVSYLVILVLTSREQHQYASASAVVEGALRAIKTVVAYGGEQVEAERYDSKLLLARGTRRCRAITLSLSLGITFFLIFTCYAIGFWFTAWLLSQQIVQAGAAFTVFFAIIIGIFSLGQAVPHLEKFVSAAGASKAVYNIIYQDPSRTPLSSHQNDAVPQSSAIQFTDVSFAYPTRPDNLVLDQFSLKIEAGQTVALVGPSGCGKTTVMQLLMRFYEITSGQVLLGGVDIRSLNLKTLRSRFGLVRQEPVLFDTTIMENIGFGEEGATIEEIEQAGRQANVHEFVSRSLPQGYNTDVGKQGTQMSGGQKQRIAIARALIRTPPILLLDDATSALDSESERIVQETLDAASAGRTTLIVSHRLSTIKRANMIVYMEQGRIVEDGTHEELMKRKGAYYEFSSTQYMEPGLEVKSSEFKPSTPASQKDAVFFRSLSDSAEGSKVEMEVSDLATSDTSQSPKVRVSWWRIWKLNWPEAYLIALGLLGATVQGAIYPVFAIFFGEVLLVFTRPFDEVLERVHVWAGTLLVVGVASGVSTFVKNITFFVSGSRLTHRLRLRTFKSILRQEVSWFDHKKNSPSQLTAHLADGVSRIQGALGVEFATLWETVVSIAVAIVISLVVNHLLALVIIGFLPFLVVPQLLQVYILNSSNAYYKKWNDLAEKVATDSINNHHTVRALSVETEFLASYRKKLYRAYQYSALTGFGYGLTYAFYQGAIFVGFAITFRFGAYQSVQPFNSSMYEGLDDIYIVFMALIFGTFALGRSQDFAPNYVRAMHAARRVFPLMDKKSAVDSSSQAGDTMTGHTGEISLHEVFFNYPTRPGVRVMSGMTLTAPAHKTTALVGPSGYGKSTVMALLERFYDPLSGSVAMDTRPLQKLNVQWLRQQIGIVFQEPVLFDRSIADNISYGANYRTVSREEVEAAAESAGIHDFIMSLPLGYETLVGEGGTLLSRGQKQRIAIARALLRDPTLLLLDEATSALDPESEREVQRVLEQAMKNRTSIVIAHRLSTIYKADKIAVLKGGRVSEEGSHSELMDKGGLYRRMYLYQSGQK